jgi:hypothetical protein
VSDAFAVNAVTTTLTQLLSAQLGSVLSGGQVTSRPPDKARDASNLTNQLNVFLYGVSINGALRNQDMPGVRAGETATPPLALDLHYLITAYGRDDDGTDPVSHILLGHAMRVLHDNAVLARADLQSAQPLSDVFQQIERIKLTPQALSVEEVYKLWTIFQTQYRISTAYQASVVLIESQKPVRTPPPVLQRGAGDRGIKSFPGTTSSLPVLNALQLPLGRVGAQLGDTLSLLGTGLTGASGARLSHTRLALNTALPLAPGATDSSAGIVVSDDPSLWAAGIYSVVLEVKRPGESFTRSTNALALALIPTLRSVSPASAASAATLTFTLTVKPAVLPLQRVSVLFGDTEFVLGELSAPATTLTVDVPAPAPGQYLVRVRVDGLDSSPVVLSGTPAIPQFAASQLVTIT